MSVEDARKVIGGGDDSVTQFFAGKTRTPLAEKFLPIVTKATEKVSLAKSTTPWPARRWAWASSEGDANIQQYVTGKALDGLFLMIGGRERKIRQNPAAAGSAILKRCSAR